MTNEKGILFLTEFFGVLMNRQNGQRTLRMQNFRETRELHLSHTTHWRASKERVICLGGHLTVKSTKVVFVHAQTKI